MRKYKRRNTLKRHQKVRDYYKELYDGKRRLRPDDALQETADHFTLETSTVLRILSEPDQEIPPESGDLFKPDGDNPPTS